MSEVDRRLSPRQMIVGLVVAASVAWVSFTFLDVWLPLIRAEFGRVFLGYPEDVHAVGRLWRGTLLYALFGLPVALTLCLVVGFPVWHYFESRGRRSAMHAVQGGALAGLIVALIVVGFTLFSAWSGSYSLWAGGRDVYVDGVPTGAAWLGFLRTVLTMMVIGAFSGVAAWMAARGRARSGP